MGDNLALRNAHRKACDVGRRAAESVGVRSNKVSVVVQTYSGGIGFTGTTLVSTSTLVLSPRPKVQTGGFVVGYFGGGDATRAGGRLMAGQFAIGPITLNFPGGGYTVAQVAPDASDSIKVYYLIEGDAFDSGGEKFEIVDVVATRPHQVTLVVERTAQ
jgi:hypothetical protein